MAYASPSSGDFLNSPSHSKMHNVVDTDTGATNQTITVNSSDNVGISKNNQTEKLDVNGNVKCINSIITGNSSIAGTLDVSGHIDPTNYEATNGGFLDEDDMASNAADKVSSQQAIKAHVATQIATIQDSTYSGGESHTLGGGLIIKMGTGTTNTKVTYEDAFPNAIVSVTATYTVSQVDAIYIASSDTSGFTANQSGSSNARTFNWIAIGY